MMKTRFTATNHLSMVLTEVCDKRMAIFNPASGTRVIDSDCVIIPNLFNMPNVGLTPELLTERFNNINVGDVTATNKIVARGCHAIIYALTTGERLFVNSITRTSFNSKCDDHTPTYSWTTGKRITKMSDLWDGVKPSQQHLVHHRIASRGSTSEVDVLQMGDISVSYQGDRGFKSAYLFWQMQGEPDVMPRGVTSNINGIRLVTLSQMNFRNETDFDTVVQLYVEPTADTLENMASFDYDDTERFVYEGLGEKTARPNRLASLLAFVSTLDKPNWTVSGNRIWLHEETATILRALYLA